MARRKRAARWLWHALPWAVLLAACVQLFEYYGWLASPEGILLDFFLGKIPLFHLFHPADSPAKPEDHQTTTTLIATLEIDDKAFNECFGHSPMNPIGIGALVQAALDAQPRAVGVDIITDSENQEDVDSYSELDRRFRGKPVVWAAGAEKTSLEEGQPPWEWFFRAEPIAVQPTAVLGKERQLGDPLHWGLPIYPREEDLRLRRFPRSAIVPPGRRWLNWASQVAQLYCEAERSGCTGPERDELFVPFKRAAEPQKFKMLDLFVCSPGPAAVEPRAEKHSDAWETFIRSHPKIVLIGGTFGSARDKYPTPIGPLDGLYFNAYAVQAELTGTGVSEWPPWFRFLLDIALGLAMARIFETKLIKSRKLNVRITWCLVVLVGTVVLSALVLYPLQYVWLSCVGIAVGMTLHVLVEIWKEDLALRAHKGH